eukprot:g120.t1
MADAGGWYQGAGGGPAGAAPNWGAPQPAPMGMGMGGAMGAGPAAGQMDLDDEDYSNEPPLLEELGVNFREIWGRTKSVLNPKRSLNDMHLEDADLAGPVIFALALASVLMLHGKLAFGSIYGVFLMGCFGVYVVLSLLSQTKEIGFFSVVSIMGYGLLPIIALASVAVFLSMRGYLGLLCSAITMGWSTYTSSRFFEKAMDMYQHSLIIAYPVGLFYACFILLTIF